MFPSPACGRGRETRVLQARPGVGVSSRVDAGDHPHPLAPSGASRASPASGRGSQQAKQDYGSPVSLCVCSPKPPARMGEAPRDRGLGVCLAVRPVHRLEKEVIEGEAFEPVGHRQRLREHQLQLAARCLDQRCRGLGADADPVEPGRCSLGAVGFDRYRRNRARGARRSAADRAAAAARRRCTPSGDARLPAPTPPRRRRRGRRRWRICRRRDHRPRRNQCRRRCRPPWRDRPRARSTGCTRQSAGTPRGGRSARLRPAGSCRFP